MIGETNGLGVISRRMFLRGGGASVALLAVAPTAWARSTGTATGSPLVRSRFTPHLGAQFRMSGDGPDVAVMLAEVNDLIPLMQAEDPNRFALVLEASVDQPPTEGIRTLHHDGFGDIALYLSSVDRGVDERHYEAVINRSHN